MDVFFVSLDDSISVDDEKILLVPSERRDKIRRFMFDEDKRASLVCGTLIRWCATRNGRISASEELAYGQYGKPYYPAHPGYNFSVSHTRSCVVYTNSDVPVGIDTEKYSEMDDTYYSVAKENFTFEEYNTIINRSDPASEFLRVWTAKEAFLKCTGEGLSRSLDSFSVYDLPHGYELSQAVFMGNYISVCCKGKCDEMVLNELTAEKLFHDVKLMLYQS